MAGKAGVIYSTTNYNIFKTLIGNRNLNGRHKDLIASIKEHGQLNPITVNEKYEVIDGQARLAALKMLGLPVEYIVKSGAGHTECVEWNNTGKRWTTRDFIKSYADLGYTSFMYLENLCLAFPDFSIKVCNYALTSWANTGKNIIKYLMKNKIDDTEYNEAIRKLTYLKNTAAPLRRLSGLKEAYQVGILFCYSLPEINKERLTKCIENRVSIMLPAPNTDIAIEQLEYVYNYHYPNTVYITDIYKKTTAEAKKKRAASLKGGK